MRASTFRAVFAALSLATLIAGAPTSVSALAVAINTQVQEGTEYLAAVEQVDPTPTAFDADGQDDTARTLDARGLTKAQKKRKAAEQKKKDEAAAKKKAQHAQKKKKQQAPVKLNAGQQFSGKGTYYFQNGNYGSCGKKNPDSAVIVAVNTPQVAGGAHCGRRVKVTNTANGKSIVAQVADECPSCSYASLDMSLGAYDQLGARSSGVLPIKWSWL